MKERSKILRVIFLILEVVFDSIPIIIAAILLIKYQTQTPKPNVLDL